STEKLKKRKQSGLTRKSVSVKAKAESKAFVDSATLYRYEIYKAINFYKIAISFNRYNLQAWYGLIDAYKSAGMNKEMKAAYAEMEKLFGKAAFSIKQIVQNFGDVQDVYRTEDNIYRIEYRSDKNTETELIQETFSIIQAVRPICNCEAISLFSSTSPGYGLMVFVKKDTPIHTSDAFTRNASIQYLK
ncbi:MAG: hypothetical protein GX640_04370, partial [Fibrobacter sp.]|nr:hypothetical protein [Fibrobacter sp.]